MNVHIHACTKKYAKHTHAPIEQFRAHNNYTQPKSPTWSVCTKLYIVSTRSDTCLKNACHVHSIQWCVASPCRTMLPKRVHVKVDSWFYIRSFNDKLTIMWTIMDICIYIYTPLYIGVYVCIYSISNKRTVMMLTSYINSISGCVQHLRLATENDRRCSHA